jgi:hypothetical protein
MDESLSKTGCLTKLLLVRTSPRPLRFKDGKSPGIAPTLEALPFTPPETGYGYPLDPSIKMREQVIMICSRILSFNIFISDEYRRVTNQKLTEVET